MKCKILIAMLPKFLCKNIATVFVPPSNISRNHMEFAQSRSSILFSEWHKSLSKSKSLNSNSDMPNITICVVTLNSEKWLDAFLDSLCALNYPRKRLSIHFVDHGSTDVTLAKLTRFMSKKGLAFLNVKLDERLNEGYGSGNDFAIRRAKDELVLVTNVDVEFYVDSLRIIANAALQDTPSVASWEFRQCPHEHPKYYDPVTQLSGWASHACILLRRTAYLEVGGYDKNIFMYGEDVELSYRLRNNGWQLRYVPSAVIQHHVDLHDLSTRPNQLSGSIAANILLRRRYGSILDRCMGKLLFFTFKIREKDPVRKEAIKTAGEIYKKHRLDFGPIKSRWQGVNFRFNGFNYSLRKEGATLFHNPSHNSNLPLVRIFTPFQNPLSQAFKDTVTTVLNQTYDNIEYVIIRETDEDEGGFFENLKCAYENRVKYVKPEQVFISSDDHFKYLCWLGSGDLLFSDHIELLTTAIESKDSVRAAQSYGWTNSAANVLSQVVVFQSDYFDKNEVPIDAAVIKRKITKLNSDSSEQLLCLPKTTSIIQAVI